MGHSRPVTGLLYLYLYLYLDTLDPESVQYNPDYQNLFPYDSVQYFHFSIGLPNDIWSSFFFLLFQTSSRQMRCLTNTRREVPWLSH